jgi:hypothetical protein
MAMPHDRRRSRAGEFLAEAQRNAYLPLLIGLALIISGWAAAMTTVGAQFIHVGMAIVVLGMVLGHRKSIVLAGIAVLFFGYGGPLILLTLLA